jgi:hypothetical protein
MNISGNPAAPARDDERRLVARITANIGQSFRVQEQDREQAA